MAGPLRQSAKKSAPMVGAAPLGLVALPDGFIGFAGFARLNGDRSCWASFGTGLTYAVTPDVQFDAGMRVGLTKATEDFGVFAGISLRY